jgi:signal transduction histidine kinase
LLHSDGKLQDQNLKMASIVQSSGRRMLGLVSDLLDFTMSRLGSGIPIVREETDLAMVVREALDEMRVRHPGRSFDLKVSGNLEGQWDGKRVFQALVNLVGNAAQHGAEDSPIEVIVRGEQAEILFSVKNQGKVISPEDQVKIFNPFKRLHSGEAIERNNQGSIGLGLYIAEQIAIAHEGGIEVESSVTGTTFELHLPRGVRSQRSPEGVARE